MPRFSHLAVAAFMAISLPLTAGARTIHVPVDEPTIQAGLAAAINGDVVMVAPGTYFEYDLEIAKGITFTSESPDDPSVVAATVIDAGANGRILTVKNRWQHTTIEGMTFQNGYAQNGGGVYFYYTDTAIRHCVCRNCVATSQGGGVYYNDSSQEDEYATFEGCRFEGNDAVNGGSAFYASYASPTLMNCVVQGNVGSALQFVFAPEPQIKNCIIADNGTGLYCYESSPVLMNCTIADNTDEGIYVSVSGSPTLTNCIVWDGGITLSGAFATADARFSNIEGSWPGIGNLNANPMFRSYRSFDYLLAPNSPCLDMGDPSIQDGLSDSHPKWPEWYPNGARSDMGAYGGSNNRGWLN